MGSDRPHRPAIVVLAAAPAGAAVREVCAGIEEEGVPHLVLAGDGDAVELARSAARRSPLDVGVGVDAGGRVCAHHDKLAAPLPALIVEPDAAAGVVRTLGHNAARIVVGLPLKPLEAVCARANGAG